MLAIFAAPVKTNSITFFVSTCLDGKSPGVFLRSYANSENVRTIGVLKKYVYETNRKHREIPGLPRLAFTMQETADILGIGLHTVDGHRKHFLTSSSCQLLPLGYKNSKM